MIHTDNFNKFLNEFNEPNVKETLCLFNCMKINQKFNKDEIKNYTTEQLNKFLDCYTTEGIVELLKGQYHEFIKDGYLGYDEDLMKDFIYLKFVHSFPKLKGLPKFEDLKNNLINKINSIFNNDISIHQSDKEYPYSSYVYFTVRHILNYCVKIDKDFVDLAKEMPGIQLLKKLDNPNLPTYFNSLLKSYLANPYSKDIQKEMANLTNTLSGRAKHEIIIPNFGSHQKGQLGENIYSSINNSEAVGHKNNKVDIIEDGNGISLKSSFSSVWNNHLAYLNSIEHKDLIESLRDTKPLSKIRINWSNIIEQLITNNEDIKDLVFQKLKVDELSKEPISIKIWKFNVNEILNIIENKQFIFTNNSIVLYHEQENLMKIVFKKRTNNIQAVILTDEISLNNAVLNGLGIYNYQTNKEKKNKI